MTHQKMTPAAVIWPLGGSTLGAPDQPLSTVLKWLTDAGASRLELRVGEGEPVSVHSSRHARAQLRDQVADAGIDLFALASYVRTASEDSDEHIITDLQDHLRLAADLGATFVRVFPGAPIPPGPFDRSPTLPDGGAADDRIVRRLAAVSDLATELRVRPVLETHDSHPRGEDIGRVLAQLGRWVPDHPVGAIWDVLHPFRVGESPAHSTEQLAPHLVAGRGYVQIKDVRSRTELTPVNPGEGIVPLGEIFDHLHAADYAGPVSLEWERAWYPQIAALPEPLAAAAMWLDEHRPERSS